MSKSVLSSTSGGVTGLAVLSLDDMVEGDDSGLEEKVEELVGLLGGSPPGKINSLSSSPSTCNERVIVHSSSSSRISSSEWCEER